MYRCIFIDRSICISIDLYMFMFIYELMLWP